jgi:F-type H+-transporting ATPase subunit b
MEILKNFGFNPLILGAQIVNFLIIFFILKKFAFKPILAILEKRKKEIEEGVKHAEESRRALEKALEEEKKILKKAQTEAQKILLDAKNQADQTASDMKTQAKEQVAKMIQEAREQSAREEKEMEKRVAVSAAKLAVEMVEKSISGVFTEKEQKESIEKLAKNLKTIE